MRAIEGLVDLRKRRIDTIRNYVRTVQEERLKGTRVFCSDGEHPGGIQSTHCDALHFGHFMQSMTKAGLLDDEVWNHSPLDITLRIQQLESLPKMLCTWVPEMKKVSFEAIEMDLCLKLSDFSR